MARQKKAALGSDPLDIIFNTVNDTTEEAAPADAPVKPDTFSSSEVQQIESALDAKKEMVQDDSTVVTFRMTKEDGKFLRDVAYTDRKTIYEVMHEMIAAYRENYTGELLSAPEKTKRTRSKKS